MSQLTLPQRIDFTRPNPAEAYLSSLSSSASERTMRSCLKRAAEMLGRESLFDADWRLMRRQHILSVMDQLRLQKFAPATINLYLAALKGTAKEAWSSDQMTHAAYLKISTIRGIQYVRLPAGRTMNLRECRQILNTCNDASLKGTRDKALFGVMMGCGLRRAEIVLLTIDHWDAAEKAFRFIGKGNKERMVFLPPDIVPLMKTWIDKRGDAPGPLFPRIYSHNGKEWPELSRHMKPNSIYRLVRRQQEKAGLQKLTPHDFRRTYATRTLEAGVDIFVLQGAMGHASPTTTARYDRRDLKALAKAARALRF